MPGAARAGKLDSVAGVTRDPSVAPARGHGGRRHRPCGKAWAQITRLAATGYDLPAVPSKDPPVLPRRRNGDTSIARHATKGVHPMTYVIAEPCIDVKDKSCIEECPVDCIYEGDRMLYIHPDECVDCGACEPVCPVEAIFYEDDVPAQWKDFTTTNAAFFEELGSPGGAAKVGPQPRDTDFVANYQPTE
jgi:ferredoxin